MSLEDMYFVSQIVAAVAIVASLIFVGIQVRQSDKTQRALMHQARIERSISFSMRWSEPDFVPLMARVALGDTDLDQMEIYKLMLTLRTQALAVIDAEWQHRAGLIDTPTLDIVKWGAENWLRGPAVRAAWHVMRMNGNPEMVAALEPLAKGPTRQQASGDWKQIWGAAVRAASGDEVRKD